MAVSNWEFELDSHKTTVAFEHDLLTLSCAAYRFRRDHDKHYYITDVELGKQLTTADHELRNKVAYHFKKQFTIDALKGKEDTRYVRDLKHLLSLPSSIEVEKDLIGIAYFLPYFFEYDNEVTALIKAYAKFEPEDKELSMGYKTDITVELVKKLTLRRRNRKHIEYWVRRVNDNVLMKYAVSHDNPLIVIFDKLMASGPINLTASYNTVAHRDGSSYIQITKLY